MKSRTLLFIVILSATLFTAVSCKKIFLEFVADTLMSAFDLWEDRPQGIPCNQALSNATINIQELTFDRDHMLCINISMDASDFDNMRNESKFGPNIYEDDGNAACAVLVEYAGKCDVPFPSYYNWYSGNLVIDGLSLSDVGLRKKGFLGSIFSAAPSMRIITNKYVSGQSIGATHSITLNNNSQDDTRIWTSLGYKIFELANYPAPRANFANVSINDEALGVYTHLEPIDEKFLKRAFGNNAGHLYEGQIIDFEKEWLPRWDPKTASTNQVGLPIIDIAKDLDLPDNKFLSALEQHLNIDRFITFWALEALLALDDGYCSNRNNFFIYFDPNDGGRVTFIPWGLDYHGENEASLENFVHAELPRRLSRIPAMASKFETELQRLLDDVWDEPAFLSFIDSAATKVASAQIDPDYQNKVDNLKTWIQNRRAFVKIMLAIGLPKGNEKESNKCTND